MSLFQWFPFLPSVYYAGLALAVLAVAGLAFYKRMPDFYFRAAFFVLVALILLNPVVLHETRQGLPDKLVIVMDDSASQKIAGRDAVAQKALDYIQASLKKMHGAEPIIIRAGTDTDAAKGESTNLFTDLRNSLSNIPMQQVAGTVLITDGQVHDVPEELKVLERLSPFHVVLTGKKDEFDRKVTLVTAPKYGLLNEDISISVKIEEFGKASGAPIALHAMQDGQAAGDAVVQAGETHEFSFKLKHAGQNIFEFSIPAEAGELTEINNSVPVIVNGVRDRLRVLLVSGSPHMGERSWRNLLKSDPAIDLVHFTILRSPSAMDATPQNELALIAFPVDELFQRKLQGFDLVIFDRYQQYSLLSQQYFLNIANYVKSGGALLMAMGTDEIDKTLFSTPIGDLLPVTARGDGAEILKETYAPQLTDAGKTHPITSDLMPSGASAHWGDWYTQVDVDAPRGQTLMTGSDGHPLLVVDKAGDGRVAVLTSDNIWLWSKGDKQAGPYSKLLRNVSHWLMKEPELEDGYIKAEAKGKTVTVSARNASHDAMQVTMRKPSGEEAQISLDKQDAGWIKTDIDADENGIYSFTHGDKKAFVVVGTALNQEFSDVHTTEDKLKPIVDKSHGGIVWFQDHPDFALRNVSANAGKMGGDDWLGLKQNGAYSVSRVDTANLLPDSAGLLLILLALMAMWWRESGKRK